MKPIRYVVWSILISVLAGGMTLHAQSESTVELLEELRQLRAEVERRKKVLNGELEHLNRQEGEVRKRKALLQEIGELRGELRVIDAMETVDGGGKKVGIVDLVEDAVPMLVAEDSVPIDLPAEEMEDEYATLLGDWGGGRADLAAAGVEVEVGYVADVAGVLSGGIETGITYLDNVDLVANLDLEKLFGWNQTTFSLYGIGNNGGDPSGEFGGDAQGFDNIESGDAWKVYELWIQKEWADGDFSALFGLYDLNGEFDVRDSAGLFLNSSQGIASDYSQAGENGPSIFPTTSLSLRLRSQFTPTWYGRIFWRRPGIYRFVSRTGGRPIRHRLGIGYQWRQL